LQICLFFDFGLAFVLVAHTHHVFLIL